MASLDRFTKRLSGSPNTRNSTNVYGSRFASEHMPSEKLPDEEMPRDTAYRMIKDDLVLDGIPMLK